MSARQELRLRLQAVEYLVEATGSAEGRYRDDLVRRAKDLISRADCLDDDERDAAQDEGEYEYLSDDVPAT